MKNSIIFIISLCITLSSFSQLTRQSYQTIKWNSIESSKKDPQQILIGSNHENFYVINTVNDNKVIEMYDINNLSLKESVIMDLKFSRATTDGYYLSSFMLKGIPIIISGLVYNKSGKLVEPKLFYQIINPNTLRISAKKEIDIGLIIEKSFNDVPSIVSLIRKNKITKDGINNEFILKLFDEDFEEVVSTEFEIPFDYFQIRVRKYHSDGKLYMVCDELVKIDPKNRKGKGNYDLYIDDTYLLSIDIITGKVNTVKLIFDDYIITEDIFLSLLKNNDIVISGFIKNPPMYGIEGCFSMRYDNNLTKINSKLTVFEDSFITLRLSEKERNLFNKRNIKRELKGKAIIKATNLNNYNINHIVELDDGSITILAEENYIYYNGQDVTTHYLNLNIIAIHYNEEGEFVWKKMITKKQDFLDKHIKYSDKEEYFSYFIIVDEDIIDIIYNENDVVLKVRLHANGDTKKEILSPNLGDKNVKLMPLNCIQLKDDKVFFYAKGKKSRKFGILEF